MAPYDDNANILPHGAAAGRLIFEALVTVLRNKGFVLRGEIDSDEQFDFLGMTLDGVRGQLHHTPKHGWQLWMAIAKVLDMGSIMGDVARVLAGHLCHQFGLFWGCWRSCTSVRGTALAPSGL